MAKLSEVIADPARRKAVVDDGVRVIDQEVADKGGLSGIAIKGAFKVVQGIRPGFIPMALNHLLDDFSRKLDPFWDECQAQGGDARGYFNRRGTDVANALLSITDSRARNAIGPARKTYDALRPKAVEHVVSAMPRLADLVKKHAS